MKKILFILTVAFLSLTAHAQLLVDSLGRAAFGTTTNSSYQINVEGANSGINCTSGTGFPFGTTAINATAYQKHNYEAVAIKGTVYSGSSGDSFCVGVYGLAGSQCAGKNIGLYGGIVPHYYGTALYASSSCYNGLHALDSRYAGFFDGDVYIDNALTVNGVIVNTPPRFINPTPLRQNDVMTQTIAGKLRQIVPSTYDMEVPKSRDTFNIKKDSLSSDGEAGFPKEIPLSLIQKQALAKKHYGLDTDQIEEVFPDLVYENEGGTKSINYVEMVPILIQAINELSAKVETLEGGKDVKKMRKATGMTDTESVQLLYLGQNKPNPFSTQTDIEVSVPESVQKAFLYVYDLHGKKVQQVDITARGKQTVKMETVNLTEGMYLYSLIADGKVVETKRMIVEK